jgi:DNA-damage-inducible protein D
MEGTTMAESAVSAFEQIKHTDEQGEYWLARELGKLLGYDRWQNFLRVIHEAMEVCRVQGGSTEVFFTAISKKSSGRGRPSAEYDYRLTRHACYMRSGGPLTLR